MTWMNSSTQNGWGVHVTDSTKDKYGPILTTLANCPVTTLEGTFRDCNALRCSPEIPNSVISLQQAFRGCTSLQTVSYIPANVRFLADAFAGCTALTGTIIIDANAELNYSRGCFYQTSQPIVLTGSCPILEALTSEALDGNVQVAK